MNTPFDPNSFSPPRRSSIAGLRASFLTGLVVITPIAMTTWLLWTFVGWVDSFVLPLVPPRLRPEHYIGINLRGVGVIFFLTFTILIGWFAKGFIGRSLIHWGESLVARTPIVRSLYGGLKQIAETVFAQSERSFDRVVLVEYPRRGLWCLAFVSTTAKGEIATKLHSGYGEILTLLIPTTPNPTAGYLLYAPARDVVDLEMSVEDAAKLIISAGLVYPDNPPEGGKVTRLRKRADAGGA